MASTCLFEEIDSARTRVVLLLITKQILEERLESAETDIFVVGMVTEKLKAD